MQHWQQGCAYGLKCQIIWFWLWKIIKWHHHIFSICLTSSYISYHYSAYVCARMSVCVFVYVMRLNCSFRIICSAVDWELNNRKYFSLYIDILELTTANQTSTKNKLANLCHETTLLLVSLSSLWMQLTLACTLNWSLFLSQLTTLQVKSSQGWGYKSSSAIAMLYSTWLGLCHPEIIRC